MVLKKNSLRMVIINDCDYMWLLWSFEFIVSFIGIYRLLHTFAGTTNRIEGCAFDIINAYDDISSVIKDVKTTKSNIDE